MYHYPDLDSASVVSDLMVEANFQSIRSTTQTWGVTIPQCGISALVSQVMCSEYVYKLKMDNVFTTVNLPGLWN